MDLHSNEATTMRRTSPRAILAGHMWIKVHRFSSLIVYGWSLRWRSPPPPIFLCLPLSTQKTSLENIIKKQLPDGFFCSGFARKDYCCCWSRAVAYVAVVNNGNFYIKLLWVHIKIIRIFLKSVNVDFVEIHFFISTSLVITVQSIWYCAHIKSGVQLFAPGQVIYAEYRKSM